MFGSGLKVIVCAIAAEPNARQHTAGNAAANRSRQTGRRRDAERNAAAARASAAILDNAEAAKIPRTIDKLRTGKPCIDLSRRPLLCAEPAIATREGRALSGRQYPKPSTGRAHLALGKRRNNQGLEARTPAVMAKGEPGETTHPDYASPWIRLARQKNRAISIHSRLW